MKIHTWMDIICTQWFIIFFYEKGPLIHECTDFYLNIIFLCMKTQTFTKTCIHGGTICKYSNSYIVTIIHTCIHTYMYVSIYIYMNTHWYAHMDQGPGLYYCCSLLCELILFSKISLEKVWNGRIDLNGNTVLTISHKM